MLQPSTIRKQHMDKLKRIGVQHQKQVARANKPALLVPRPAARPARSS